MCHVARKQYRAALDRALDSLLNGTRLVALRDLALALPEQLEPELSPPGPVALSKILKGRGWRKLEQPGPAMFLFGSEG